MECLVLPFSRSPSAGMIRQTNDWSLFAAPALPGRGFAGRSSLDAPAGRLVPVTGRNKRFPVSPTQVYRTSFTVNE